MTVAEKTMPLIEAMTDRDLALRFMGDPQGAIESAPISEAHKRLLREGDLAGIQDALREEIADLNDSVEGHRGLKPPAPDGWDPLWVLALE